jgi:hypothetical protein
MSKIGILANSSHCHQYLFETLEKLSSRENIELFLLVNKNINLNSSPEKGLFKIAAAIEKKILFALYPDLKQQDELCDLLDFGFSQVVELNPDFCKADLSLTYSREDIHTIKSLHLDLIIKDDFPFRLPDDLAKTAKDGIISILFEGQQTAGDSPPGFWNVYRRIPAVGFTLRQQSENPEKQRMLFGGRMPTSRSYTENKINLYSGSYPFLTKTILQYAQDHKIPTPKGNLPFEKNAGENPSFAQTLIYIFKTLWFFFNLGWNRRIVHKLERWSVAFIKSPWQEAHLEQGTIIKNPPNRFFADPFVMTKDNRTICFLEDFDYSTKRGCITAVEILGDGQYQILGPVIEEPFHMSFPYLFQYNGQLYMVPEAAESNAVKLYECVEFPLKWEFKKDIFSDYRAVDPMIFEHQGRWWLLCNKALEGNGDLSSILMAYWSDDPIDGTWNPHPENPLIFDCNIARNGGILLAKDEAPIRGRQKQGFYFYGKGLSLARIKDLSPSSFEEEEIRQIDPTFFKGIKGCHHIHSSGIYTVYDFVRFESPK